MAIDYQGIAVLVSSLTVSGLSVATFIRAGNAATSALAALQASITNSAKLEVVTANVKSIEKNTNSLSERLESAARKEGAATGHAQGIADERANPQVSATIPQVVVVAPPGFVAQQKSQTD